VTAETAILLSQALGTTPALWLNLQVAVDLWDAQQRLGRTARSPGQRRGLPYPRKSAHSSAAPPSSRAGWMR
jgi:hypothetical protein